MDVPNALCAAVNTGDLLHIAVPINGMNENNYINFKSFFQI